MVNNRVMHDFIGLVLVLIYIRTKSVKELQGYMRRMEKKRTFVLFISHYFIKYFSDKKE